MVDGTDTGPVPSASIPVGVTSPPSTGYILTPDSPNYIINSELSALILTNWMKNYDLSRT